MSDVVFYRFQPDAMDKELLERLFTGRNRKNQLKKLAKEIESAVKNQTPRYYLIIGPRGVGKTHFITLLYYDVIERIENVLPIKLSEEEFSIYRVSDLLLRILEMTEGRTDFSDFERMSDDEVVIAALDELKSKGKLIVLFLENLNQILGKQMSKKEVQRLRSIFQTENIFTVVTTAPLVFPQVSEHQEPFFNFFDIIYLKELTRGEIKELVMEIASIENNEEFLSNMDEYARKIDAVGVLTGGSPRMAILLYELMSKGKIADVEKAFFKLLDENTPYYQDVFTLLSAEKRKVFDTLITIERPATPKEIAKKARLDDKTVNTLLRRLEKDGYVISRRMGKTTKYEVRERLFRLWRELRRQPFAMQKLSILVEFLELWYSPEERKENFLEHFEHLDGALEETRARETSYWFSSLPEGYKKELIPRVVKGVYEVGKVKLLDELVYGDKELKAEATKAEFMILLEKGNYEELLKKAEEMIKVDKNDVFMWVIKSVTLGELERYEEALEASSKSIELNPKLALTWLGKGRAFADLERYEEALEVFSKSIELNPDNALAWGNKGIVLANLERPEEALEALSKSVELNPEDDLTWNIKGGILGGLGRYEEALEALSKSVELNPDNALAWHGKGLALRDLDRPEEALEAFSKSIELNPEDADAWFMKGMALIDLGRDEEALDALTKAIKLNPEDADALFFKGWTLGKLERHEEALEAFSKSIELNSEHADAWFNNGLVLGNLGRHEEALEALTKSIELNPEHALAWFNKGLALGKLGRHEGALEAFSKSTGVKPDNALAWLCKGATLVDLERYEEALEALSKAVELNPKDARTWLLKGGMHLILSLQEFNRSNYGIAIENQNAALDAFDTYSALFKDKEKTKKIISKDIMALLEELIAAKNVEAVEMALNSMFEKKKELKELFEPISIALEIVKSKDVSKFYNLQVEMREVVADIVKKLTGSEELLPEEYKGR
ncbi:MAG: tetratricopeptide repeat protein [Methanosarcinales archaeon]